MKPTISVIIPVYNSERTLRRCLEHLKMGSIAPLECIVVDDASTDGSGELAEMLGAKVVRVDRRRGPAHARNLGAQAARGDVLFFLDADVCVHPDTVERVQAAFAEDPALDAVIGSYDTSPEAKDFLSQYKNLMHCFVHQQARREACTFWSGCGAIRREVFFRHAGFDETYERPAIEDIELGYRMQAAGRKVILDKELQVKHLKRWTFWGLLKTDILDRGIPWTELILRDHYLPNDLNLEISQRVSVALAFSLVAVAIAAAFYWGAYFLVPLMVLLVLLLSRYWLEFARGPRSGVVLTVFGALVGVIVWLAVRHGVKHVVYPLILGSLLLLLRQSTEERSKRWNRVVELVVSVYIVAVVVYMGARLPYHWIIFAFFVIGALLLVLNQRFYRFLAARRGKLFALAAVPFHILYHLYNGLSLAAGIVHYSWMRLARKRQHAPAKSQVPESPALKQR
ncbi:MAG: glycosyltransferase family 2 protein [Bryobacteraceae bacterium]